LEEAAKNNEEAQAVITQLKKSLSQLENRFRQARPKGEACYNTANDCVFDSSEYVSMATSW